MGFCASGGPLSNNRVRKVLGFCASERRICRENCKYALQLCELQVRALQIFALQLEIKNVGKGDPKRHLEEKVDVRMTNIIVQCMGAMLDTIVFK